MIPLRRGVALLGDHIQKLTENASPDPSKSQVTGMNIFWALLPLCAVCSLHPLGHAMGVKEHKYIRYLRILPLTAIVDAVVLLVECFSTPQQTQTLITPAENGSFQQNVRRQATRRLLRSVSGLSKQQDASSRVWRAIIPFIVDIRPRLLLDAIVVLQYTKLMSYSGLRWSAALATVYFAIWLVNELVLLVAYGWSGRAAQLHTEDDEYDVSRATDDQDAKDAVLVGKVLVAFQLFAICIVVGGWAYSKTSQKIISTSFILSLLFWPAQLFVFVVDEYFGWLSKAGFQAGWKVVLKLLLACLGFVTVLLLVTILTFIQIFWLFLFYLIPRAAVKVYESWLARLLKERELSLLRVIIGLIIVVVIVYLTRLFDGNGTSKPEWAENLP